MLGGASLAREGRLGRRLTQEKNVQTNAGSPERILEIGYGFQQAKALLSAVELGIFSALAEGPLDVKALVAQLGLHGRGARDFFDALVALDLLERGADDRYANRPASALYLDRRKPTYLGGLLEHLNIRHYQNWSLLTQALRTGAPQSGALGSGSYSALYADTTSQEIFLNGMSAGSLITAKALAEKFPWERHRTIIDIGTAEGCVPVEIARMHPHLTGGGFDLPAVAPAFAKYVRRHGLADRLQFYSGNFFADPLPEADVLVMGRILHNWDIPTRQMLLQKACRALSPSGALIVYDPLIDEGRRWEAHGLLSSLNMLIETQGGSEYTGAECAEWMRQAGFHGTRIEPLGDVHTAVVGLKSGELD
jgi:SAM-dependent methyltransferase